jgi:hypothetical protein
MMVMAYPNPTSDELTLEFKDAKNLESLPAQVILYAGTSTKSVRSISVKEVFERKGFKDGNKIKVDIRNLPRGIYYLHVISNNEKEDKIQKIRILLE